MKAALPLVALIMAGASFTHVRAADLTPIIEERRVASESGGPAGRECSIASLEKLIVPATAMHPQSAAGEPVNDNRADAPNNSDEPKWSIWDGEFDTPRSVTIRLLSRNGEMIVRVSFLDRHNYVMSETLFDYPDNINVLLEQKRPITVSPGRSRHLFFCADRLQVPSGTSTDAAERLTTIGNNQRSWFFDEAVRVAKVDLSKIR